MKVYIGEDDSWRKKNYTYKSKKSQKYSIFLNFDCMSDEKEVLKTLG